MTVRDWLERRSPQAPAALLARVLDTLGADADSPADRLPEVCLGAARRVLDGLIAEQRFSRDSATDLLAVDALVTWAYEYAGALGARTRVEALTIDGARMLAQLTDQHV